MIKRIGVLILATAPLTAQSLAQSWESAPAFPDSGQARAYAAGVNRAGVYFAIGGTPLGTAGDKDTPIHILLPGATTWNVGPWAEGRVVRQGAGVDELGRIIVFGGVDGVDPEGDPGAAYVYDPNDGQSQAIANRGPAAPDDYFAWATDDQGRIYSLGGGPGGAANSGAPNTNYAERYIGATDVWETIAPLPAPVANAAAVFDGRGHILVLGGFDESATSRRAAVMQYEIAMNTWSTAAIPDMPMALTGHRAMLGADERIYVGGGESGPVGGGSTQAAVYILNQDTNTWTAGPTLSEPRRHFAMVLGDDDYIYALGGENDVAGTNTAEKLYTPPCPTIISSPESLTAWSGSLAGFSVAAVGAEPFTYQWRKDGQDLSDGPSAGGGTINGATSAALTLNGLGTDDAGAYDVVVSNACGDTVSPFAELSVNLTPAIPTNWEVVSIHPAWAEFNSYARGIGNGRIGGDATTPTLLPDDRVFNLAHPVVWDAETLTYVDVTPGGSIGGGINDVEGDLLGGWFWHTWNCPGGGQTWTCAWQSAGFWTAPTLHFTEAAHSSGYEFDYIYGTDGAHMAGTLVYEDASGIHYPRAYMWSAANYGNTLQASGWTRSVAYAIDGDRQYGYYYADSSASHAVMWAGAAASNVDLHPAEYSSSTISGAGDGQAVGVADSHAGLWVGSADAFVDLHPIGATSSSGVAAHQGIQAGNASNHAALWAGSPESYFDLGAYVPAGFTSSYADDFEVAPDGSFKVVGYGYNSNTGRTEALLWRSVTVIPGDLDGDGDVDLSDLATLLAAYGACVGDGAYNAAADLDESGCVDLGDLATLLSNYGA